MAATPTSLLALAVFTASVVAMPSQQNNNQDQTFERSTSELAGSLLSSLQSSGDGSSNTLLSPFGVAVALGMVYEGLGQRSRDNLAKEIGFSADLQQFNRDVKSTLPPVSSPSTTYASLLAMAVSANILPSYATSLRNVFESSVFRHPFETNPDAAIDAINSWVKKASKDKITDILPEGSITSSTKLVLVNVLHFKSAWESKAFAPVPEGNFTLADGRQVPAKLMADEREIGLLKDSTTGHDVIEIPFEDPDTSFVVVLPAQGKDVSTVLRDLTVPQLSLSPGATPDLSSMISDPASLPRVQASIVMPKFRIEKSISLKSPLTAAYNGLSEIFSTRADFSGMANNTEGFLVDDIHHKTVIEVEEGGVEAAAATAVTIVLKSSFVSEEVRLTRPFLFFVVDKRTKSVLFAGRLENPNE